jgi:hypothetical protein
MLLFSPVAIRVVWGSAPTATLRSPTARRGTPTATTIVRLWSTGAEHGVVCWCVCVCVRCTDNVLAVMYQKCPPALNYSQAQEDSLWG